MTLASSILLSLLTAFIGGVIGHFFGRYSRRIEDEKQLIQGVSERYIAYYRKFDNYDDIARVLGAMQHGGVGMLTGTRQIDGFRQTVIGLGCPDPWDISEINSVIVYKHLPSVIRTASLLARDFSREGDYLEFMLDIYHRIDKARREKRSIKSRFKSIFHRITPDKKDNKAVDATP